MMLGYRRVAANQVLLDDNAAAYRFDGTVENRNEAVPGRLDQLPMMFRDAGLYQVALDPLDAVVRSFFVDFHEPAVAGDIACNDGSQSPRAWLARRLASSARLDVADFSHRSDSFLELQAA